LLAFNARVSSQSLNPLNGGGNTGAANARELDQGETRMVGTIIDKRENPADLRRTEESSTSSLAGERE